MAPLLSEEELALGNPYELLGVQVEATEQEIRKAYRKMSVKLHPDKNPDNKNAAAQFFQISLAVNLLTDSAKRSFLNGRLDEEKQKKERYAEMNKKKRGLLDALQAREEEAKRAKLDLARAHADASAEASVQEAGRKMREQAARAIEEVRLREISERRKERVEKRAMETGADLDNRDGNEEGESPLDYTLLLQFPPFPLTEDPTLPGFLTSPETFQTKVSTLYGSLENVVFSPQAGPSSVKPKKSKKLKGGAKAIVEFKKSNRDGCWACWKDHQDGGPTGSGGSGGLGVQGVKVGFAGRGEGEVPSWVTRLEGTTSTRSTSASTRTTSIPGDLGRVPTSFPAAANSFPSRSRADPNQDKDEDEDKEEGNRKAGDEFESGILFRMRRMERERMEAEIRRAEEEEEEGAGTGQ